MPTNGSDLAVNEPLQRDAASRTQATERLNCLLDVAQVINSSLDLRVVLDRILSHAKNILGAESGSIMLVDETTGNLVVLAAHGPRAQSIEGRQQNLGEGVAGWVALHGTPLHLRGSGGDLPFKRICDRQDVKDALCVPLRVDNEVLGVLSVSNQNEERRDRPFTTDDLELLTALANHAAIAIRNARSYQQIRRQHWTLERLLQEVTHAHEEERMRIALLIHDGPAQTLFAALRNVEVARRLAGQERPDLAAVMEELERTIRQAIQETRTVMIDLRPTTVEQQGLQEALRQYVAQFGERTGIDASFEIRGLRRRLHGLLESCFYRIAQEALTNVWKHAEARRAGVVLEIQERSCSLEVWDDGKGFDPEAVAMDVPQHLGMTSLRDRAELVGGQLVVTSAPGCGTTLRVTVPLMRSPAPDGDGNGATPEVAPEGTPAGRALEAGRTNGGRMKDGHAPPGADAR